MLEDKESGYRAKVILLKIDGFAVPELRRAIAVMMATLENGYAGSMKRA